jgi:hypothetical protein
VGRLVGVSAAAANSLLAMLAQEGRVRIALVEAVTRRAVVAA